MDFSIVLIVNNMEMFEEFQKSLSKQEGIQYELCPIMNLHGEFNSARIAYNSVLSKCTGRYILFTHQDIRFGDTNVLKKIKDQLSSLKDFGVVGAAGAKQYGRNRRKIYSNMVHGEQKKQVGIKVSGVQEVQTVDECFFIVDERYIKLHKFSESEGWHLYAVELCLELLTLGGKNYVIPIDVWHISDGKSLDAQYVYQLEKVIKKYGDYFPIIYTTVKAWKTKGMVAKLYRKYYIIKQKVKRGLLQR